MGSQRAAEPDTVGRPLVVTGEDELRDPVLAACAAVGVDPLVVTDAADVRTAWSGASVVIVGVDTAERVAGMVLPRRTQAFVVSDRARLGRAVEWSAVLRATVIPIEEGLGWLGAALQDAGPGSGRGIVVAVAGGSGGVGASTLAGGLAWLAGRDGHTASLVDLDPVGGGADLLFGLERVPGWRWAQLRSARGRLGELAAQLPAAETGAEPCRVLSMARPDASEITPEATAAVVAAAAREHALTVLDIGRTLDPCGREGIRCADVTFVVARADVRGIAAARLTIDRLEPLARDLRLVLRVGRDPADAIAAVDAVGLPTSGRLPDEPGLRSAAERGDPPGRAGRARWNRACRQLLRSLGSLDVSGAA